MHKGILTVAGILLLAGTASAAPVDEIYDWRMKEGVSSANEMPHSGSSLALYETQNDEIYGEDVVDGNGRDAYNICQKRVVKASHDAWRD